MWQGATVLTSVPQSVSLDFAVNLALDETWLCDWQHCGISVYNINNTLFMAPSLARAQSADKDVRIHSFHHKHTHTHILSLSHTHTHARTRACVSTHTHYKYMHYWWWVGTVRIKRQISIQKRRDWFLALTFKKKRERESGDEFLTGRGRESQITCPVYQRETSQWLCFAAVWHITVKPILDILWSCQSSSSSKCFASSSSSKCFASYVLQVLMMWSMAGDWLVSYQPWLGRWPYSLL